MIFSFSLSVHLPGIDIRHSMSLCLEHHQISVPTMSIDNLESHRVEVDESTQNLGEMNVRPKKHDFLHQNSSTIHKMRTSAYPGATTKHGHGHHCSTLRTRNQADFLQFIQSVNAHKFLKNVRLIKLNELYEMSTMNVYLELSLFDSNVVVTMQTLATEILGPIGILVIEHEQRETTIFVEWWSCCTRNSRTLGKSFWEQQKKKHGRN